MHVRVCSLSCEKGDLSFGAILFVSLGRRIGARLENAFPAGRWSKTTFPKPFPVSDVLYDVLIFCPRCKKTVSDEAATCSRCGARLGSIVQAVVSSLKGEHPEASDALDAPDSCPACGSRDLVKLNATSRTKAFMQGRLRTCFKASHRCSSCGHLI